MKKKNWIVSLILLLCLLVAGFIGCCHKTKPTDTLTETKLMIQKEIPIGTTADQVEKFLTQKNIEHSFNSKENHFWAKIHDTKNSSLLFSRDIQIIISLDNNKRVKKVDMEEFVTGL